MKLPFLGAISLALISVASCDPAYADASAKPTAACISPDQINAEDQKMLDGDPQFAGYKSRVVVTIQGAAVQIVADFLTQLGAPDYVKQADTFVILTADEPKGGQPLSNRHVVAFKGKCEIGGGLRPEGDRRADGR